MMSSIIENDNQFKRFINLPNELLFLNWEWSNQARSGLQLLEKWINGWNDKENQDQRKLYIVFPDNSDVVSKWVTSSGDSLHGGGHGTLLFVQNGHVVDSIIKVHESNNEEFCNKMASRKKV